MAEWRKIVSSPSSGFTMNVGSTILWEGTDVDEHKTMLTALDVTTDRTIELPDASGKVALAGSDTIQEIGDGGLSIASGSTGLRLGQGETDASMPLELWGSQELHTFGSGSQTSIKWSYSHENAVTGTKSGVITLQPDRCASQLVGGNQIDYTISIPRESGYMAIKGGDLCQDFKSDASVKRLDITDSGSTFGTGNMPANSISIEGGKIKFAGDTEDAYTYAIKMQGNPTGQREILLPEGSSSSKIVITERQDGNKQTIRSGLIMTPADDDYMKLIINGTGNIALQPVVTSTNNTPKLQLGLSENLAGTIHLQGQGTSSNAGSIYFKGTTDVNGHYCRLKHTAYTGSREIIIPDASGTFALTSDVAALTHDGFSDFAPNEHIDWTAGTANNISTTGSITTSNTIIGDVIVATDGTVSDGNAISLNSQNGGELKFEGTYGGDVNDITLRAALVPTGNQVLTLPDKTGTLAIVDDIATVMSNATTTIKTTGSTEFGSHTNGTDIHQFKGYVQFKMDDSTTETSTLMFTTRSGETGSPVDSTINIKPGYPSSALGTINVTLPHKDGQLAVIDDVASSLGTSGSAFSVNNASSNGSFIINGDSAGSNNSVTLAVTDTTGSDVVLTLPNTTGTLLTELAEDTNPRLIANLDGNGKSITNVEDITMNPALETSSRILCTKDKPNGVNIFTIESDNESSVNAESRVRIIADSIDFQSNLYSSSGMVAGEWVSLTSAGNSTKLTRADRVKKYIDKQGWLRSDNRIKIQPQDFTLSSGDPPTLNAVSASNPTSISLSNTGEKLYAAIFIPKGYKALGVRLSGNNAVNKFMAWEADVQGGNNAARFASQKSVSTDTADSYEAFNIAITSTDLNYLLIEYNQGSSLTYGSDKLYGGYVEIERITT